jgi:peroxiredoxin
VKYTKPLLIALAVLAAVGALLFALMDKPGAPAATFTTLEGKSIALEQLRGKVVLVNFWATSCPGCIKEMPGLIETYQQYKDRGFEVVAVAMSYDPPNYVANFVQTRQLPFPVALDVNGEHARAFGNVQVTPTAFIIGKDGRILEQKLGELDFDKLKALLDRELS